MLCIQLHDRPGPIRRIDATIGPPNAAAIASLTDIVDEMCLYQPITFDPLRWSSSARLRYRLLRRGRADVVPDRPPAGRIEGSARSLIKPVIGDIDHHPCQRRRTGPAPLAPLSIGPSKRIDAVGAHLARSPTWQEPAPFCRESPSPCPRLEPVARASALYPQYRRLPIDHRMIAGLASMSAERRAFSG